MKRTRTSATYTVKVIYEFTVPDDKDFDEHYATITTEDMAFTLTGTLDPLIVDAIGVTEDIEITEFIIDSCEYNLDSAIIEKHGETV